MAKRIMFFVDTKSCEAKQKWKELEHEHPGWNDITIDVPIEEANCVIIPNMTFDCADVIDNWLKEKGLERTWLKDDEPEYYKELEMIGK